MLFCKLLGAAVLVAVGYRLSSLLCDAERQRLRGAEGALGFVRYIRSQISAYMLPMSKILADCDRDLLLSCGVDHREVSVESAPRLFRNGIADAPTAELVGDLLLALGRGDRSCDTELCDRCIVAVETRRNKLSADCEPYCSAVRAVCLCGAVGGAILLF